MKDELEKAQKDEEEKYEVRMSSKRDLDENGELKHKDSNGRFHNPALQDKETSA